MSVLVNFLSALYGTKSSVGENVLKNDSGHSFCDVKLGSLRSFTHKNWWSHITQNTVFSFVTI